MLFRNLTGNTPSVFQKLFLQMQYNAILKPTLLKSSGNSSFKHVSSPILDICDRVVKFSPTSVDDVSCLLFFSSKFYGASWIIIEFLS